MNRLTIPAVIISLAAIALLTFMLKLVHDDPSWLDFESENSHETAAAESNPLVTPDTPKSNCEESENSLRGRVEAARHCTMDSDCTLFDFGYPMDCMTSVAKSDVTALRHEYGKYEQNCEYRVYFDCPAEPMQRQPVCKNNRCTVSLQTIDILEEETLEYLGIGSSGQKR